MRTDLYLSSTALAVTLGLRLDQAKDIATKISHEYGPMAVTAATNEAVVDRIAELAWAVLHPQTGER